jgi:hypothetical protein
VAAVLLALLLAEAQALVPQQPQGAMERPIPPQAMVGLLVPDPALVALVASVASAVTAA